jgi:hypothetical protein
MDHSSRIASDLADAARALTGATLCRVWLTGPGDQCSTCAMAAECADRRQCLHLAASVGTSRRLDGPWRRFPLGAREVGRVARTLEPGVLTGEALTSTDLADPGWLALHGTTSFGVWPITAGDGCRGVLAFFAPREPDAAVRRALEALGRLAGAALAAGSRTLPASRPSPVPASTPGEGETPAGSAPRHESHATATMADVQRRAILSTLVRTGGRVSGPGGAAELLGMKPTTLESRIRRLGVRKPPRLQLR